MTKSLGLVNNGSIDLHTHSWWSDGVLSPAALVDLACQQGLQVLSLTDHDEVAGIQEACLMASKKALVVLPGVEISATWQGKTLHILGLNIRPDTPVLVRGLHQIRKVREERACKMANSLEKSGIPQVLAGVKKLVHRRVISRTHFARFLIAQGYAKNMKAVFKRYLTAGKPGFVEGEWAPLPEVVSWIKTAGGQAVIAHPGRYHLSATQLNALMEDFLACGGEGLEVVTPAHNVEVTAKMRVLAERYRLRMSQGSDFHDPNGWVKPGGFVPLAEGSSSIWELWNY